MIEKPYLLDTNVLIEPHRTFYGFDFCPGFWNFLEKEFESGVVFSVDKVFEEIQDGGDKLSEWSRKAIGRTKFFDCTKDLAVVEKYNEVSALVLESEQYTDAAKRGFLQPEEADPWICAYAAIHPCVVVTHEASDPRVQRRVSLPNVLDVFGIEYIDLFTCLRALEARFVLAG